MRTMTLQLSRLHHHATCNIEYTSIQFTRRHLIKNAILQPGRVLNQYYINDYQAMCRSQEKQIKNIYIVSVHTFIFGTGSETSRIPKPPQAPASTAVKMY